MCARAVCARVACVRRRALPRWRAPALPCKTDECLLHLAIGNASKAMFEALLEYSSQPPRAFVDDEGDNAGTYYFPWPGAARGWCAVMSAGGPGAACRCGKGGADDLGPPAARGARSWSAPDYVRRGAGVTWVQIPTLHATTTRMTAVRRPLSAIFPLHPSVPPPPTCDVRQSHRGRVRPREPTRSRASA